MLTSWRFAVGVGIWSLLVSVQAWGGEPASAGGNKPKFTAAQLEAIDALCEHGGVAIGLDEDRPGTPVISVDFAAHPEFQDEWLRQLRVFPELTTVRLSGTGLSDAGIDHLLQLPQLSDLSLGQTRITDAGLAKLARLKQLKRLDLSGVQVSAEAVAKLRKALPQLKIVVEQQEEPATGQPGPKEAGAADPAGAALPGGGGETVKRFTAKTIKQWRQRAAEIGALPESTPEGWSKSRVDPKKVLELFPKLRLRKGYVLRAYVFKSDGNSNGFVWALPDDAEYPAPADCPRLESHFLKPPKPFDALDDVMEAIEGDDVPEAYLQASIFRREIREFGAGWHGVRWGFFTVLDASPWEGAAADGDDPLSRPESRPQQWRWVAPKPTQWSPEVRLERDRAVVTFYTYTPLAGHSDEEKIEKERIILHTDTYRRGKFRPLVVEKKLAEGPNAVSP